MDFLLKIFTSIILLGFPLYFWAYIYNSLGGETKGIRSKFWGGIFLGLFSVGLIFLLTKFFNGLDIKIFFFIGVCLIFLSFLLVFISTIFGAKIPKNFLRKIAKIHTVSIFFGFLFFIIFAGFFLDNSTFLIIFIPIFFAAFFEEIAKHFTMLALMGKYFSFSLREITAFVFCVVLGFVFVENIFYLTKFGFNFGNSIFRSIFAFSAHIVSAMIAVIFWWKSLSYELGSIKYISCFLAGISLSVVFHSIYNLALHYNFSGIVFLYCFLAYGLFVYGMNKKNF